MQTSVTIQNPMLNFHLTEDFKKEWKELLEAKANLDFRINDWCTRLRTACGSDNHFKQWCMHTVGMSLSQAEEHLRRVDLSKIVSDPKTWTRLGGFSKIDAISNLPKAKQVDVVQTAIQEKLSIGTIIKRKGYAPTPVPVAPKSPTDTPPTYTEIKLLAEFIHDNWHGTGKPYPDKIKKIVARYAKR